MQPDPAPISSQQQFQTLVTDGNESPLAMLAGRAHRLNVDGDGDIASIVILSDPENGNATANTDNSISLVFENDAEVGATSFDYRIEYVDGSTDVRQVELTIAAGAAAGGWGTGAAHYMLEVDDAGDVVVETGEFHRKIYVSESADALSKADIAALEDLDEALITAQWLTENPQYGGSDDLALETEVGLELWGRITHVNQGPQSHWLLFERGYEYDTEASLIGREALGESELHPNHITAWGEGDAPTIAQSFRVVHGFANLVVSDLTFNDGVFILQSENAIFHNTTVNNAHFAFQKGAGLTLHQTSLYDAVTDEPHGEDWAAHRDRASGFYSAQTDGLLFEKVFVHKAGWEDDYDPEGSGEAGQPPSQYSHNIYVNANVYDVTFRDSITMEGASFGAQFRGGAFIEDSLFIDNNAAVTFLAGDYGGSGPLGNYTLVSNSVITSGAYKEATQIGAVSLGIHNSAVYSSFVDNVVTHLANPADPAEQARKIYDNGGLKHLIDPFYDDTIVYNWQGQRDLDRGIDKNVNIDRLDTATLDETTVQEFAALLLEQDDATIRDFANYLRAQGVGLGDGPVDADVLIAFFQDGFGLSEVKRAETATLRFEPDMRGDGLRWDNRLNWSTDDLPGTIDGDSVDLGGNHVFYGGTARINDLDLGPGGMLILNHGKLTVTGILAAGEGGGNIEVKGAGQFWVDRYHDTDLLTVEIEGGRFANTGTVDGAVAFDLSAGQAILASDDGRMTLDAGDMLTLQGDRSKVGFDGESGGTAILEIEHGAILRFEAQDGALGMIAEFRSGAFGQSTDVMSGINLEGATLEIALDGTIQAGTHILLNADEIIGTLGSVEVTGLLDTQDAILLVDYEADLVSLTIIQDGSGTTIIQTLGDAGDAQQNAELWAALTSAIEDDAPGHDPEEDILFGGPGADSFVLDGSSGRNLINDFEVGIDILDVSAAGVTAADFAAGALNLRAVDEGVLLTIGQGEALLSGLTPESLSASDFVFAAADPIDLGDPVDPMDPVEPVDPVDPVEPVEPTIPTPTPGNDELVGTANADTLSGLGGDDKLLGRGGDDALKGGAGNDIVRGGAGNDVVKGNGGDDKLKGGSGDDVISGGGGDDTLIGGSGDDVMRGGRGDDVLKSGKGDDKLIGGAGDDIFVFSGRHGDDLIQDFTQGEDRLRITAVDGFDDLAISQQGNKVEIDYGRGTILIKDADATNFGPQDLLF